MEQRFEKIVVSIGLDSTQSDINELDWESTFFKKVCCLGLTSLLPLPLLADQLALKALGWVFRTLDLLVAYKDQFAVSEQIMEELLKFLHHNTAKTYPEDSSQKVTAQNWDVICWLQLWRSLLIIVKKAPGIVGGQDISVTMHVFCPLINLLSPSC
ncbi:hypothetical protein RIF29_15221 [Crotalaria pallida]|uniref:Uncharacterized protein n=1 Tax=Crotalaria pallida TaxID=3830 RepID=A0AAN9FER7_CROPI